MKTYEQTHTINQPLVFVAGVTVLHAETEFLFSKKRNYVKMCAQCLRQNIYLVLVDPMFFFITWVFGVTHIWHIMFFDHDLFKPGDAFF